jgi:hypothetical protein
LIYRNDDYFKGWAGGLEYSHAIRKGLEAGAEYTYGSWVMHSRDTREFSRWLDNQALGLTLRLMPAATARVAPYVGAGVDVIFYSYSHFVDPDVVPLENASGTALGGHAVAGLRLFFVGRVALVGEWRYRWANEDKAPLLAHDEVGTGRGLSGASFSVGIHVKIK